MPADPLERRASGGEAGLAGCPETARSQLRRLVDGLERELAGNLIGVYLHGSLAMGCFNPQASDLDLLVLAVHRLEPSTRRSLIELLLSSSGSPHPVEISLLGRGAVRPWQYPTLFDLHYSEAWRKRYERAIASGENIPLSGTPAADPDLAAHIAASRERGVTLSGDPARSALPAVPPADLRDSLLSDLRWAKGRMGEEGGPLYGVLNACRICAYLREGRIYSKLEGGEWGLAELGARHRAVIRAAVAAYRRGPRAGERLDRAAAEALIEEVLVEARVEGGTPDHSRTDREARG